MEGSRCTPKGTRQGSVQVASEDSIRGWGERAPHNSCHHPLFSIHTRTHLGSENQAWPSRRTRAPCLEGLARLRGMAWPARRASQPGLCPGGRSADWYPLAPRTHEWFKPRHNLSVSFCGCAQNSWAVPVSTKRGTEQWKGKQPRVGVLVESQSWKGLKVSRGLPGRSGSRSPPWVRGSHLPSPERDRSPCRSGLLPCLMAAGASIVGHLQGLPFGNKVGGEGTQAGARCTAFSSPFCSHHPTVFLLAVARIQEEKEGAVQRCQRRLWV